MLHKDNISQELSIYVNDTITSRKDNIYQEIVLFTNEIISFYIIFTFCT